MIILEFVAAVVQVLSRVQLFGLEPARLLCPWDFPGKNTGVSCHALLQGIFPVQGSNPHLLHWQVDSLPLSHQGSLNDHPEIYKILILVIRPGIFFFFNFKNAFKME